MPRTSRYLTIAAALIVVSMFVACTSKSADESFAAAKSHLAKGELPAAMIELKNTLQVKPDLVEARYLLGKVLLDREEAAAAAVELRKAVDLGFPADQVVPLLAMAYVRAGEAHKVLELDAASALTAPDAVAGLKTQLAYAHAALGSPEKAEMALTQALQANGSFAPALELRARTLIARRDFDGALRIADGLVARAPADVDALTLKADALLLSNGLADATALYQQVLAGKPDHLPAHIGLLSQSLAMNDLDTARLQFAALKKVRPGHPQTLYFEARLALQGGDIKAAAELVQQLMKTASADPQALRLAGTVALQRNDLESAEKHFRKLVQLVPGNVQGRLLLAGTYLRFGDASRALDVLQPVLEGNASDADALALAGSAYLQLGDLQRAEAMFVRVAKLKPDDIQNRVSIALAKIARGDVASGLRDLEAAADADKKGTNADMALIAALLKRRNHDAALKAIDRLQNKQPDKAQPLYLRGQVLAQKGDLVSARTSYEESLTAQPGYFPAVDGLAALDLREKKPEQARARFEAALKANPSEARAILGLAILDEQAGKPKHEVTARLAKAVAITPSDPMLRRRLIEYHMRKQDYKLALAAAQDAVATLPDDANMLALLAGAQLAYGDANQAINSYSKLITAQPKSPGPLLGLAEAQLMAKSYDAAAEAVRKAQVLAPESAKVMQTAVKVDVLAGKYEQALGKARAMQARTPKAPHGWIFEGDVELARRNWPAAAAAFRIALQKQDSTTTAQQLYFALRNSGDKAKTEAFALEWLKQHPQDQAFLLYLAGRAIEDKDFEMAVTRLEELLRVAPDNPLALNDLAWVQATLKKPGAVANAERVNQLSPNQPIFLDTLAYALATEGNFARAIEVQKMALALAPSANALRLNMARLYMQAGDKPAARAELDTLAKLGDGFAKQNEVRELQSKL